MLPVLARRSRARRRLLPVASGVVVLTLVALCSGCGADSESSSSPQPAPPVESPLGPTVAPTVTALPDSVLQPLPDMTYRRTGTVDVPAGMQESSSWVSGFLSRAIILKNDEVGRVQVIRLAASLSDIEAQTRVASLISSYLGGAAPASQTIEGFEVMIGERVKGTSTSVAIFKPNDHDVVLLSSAQGLAATVTMTRVWLASVAKTKQ
jgi:hypothetical protein